MHMIIGIHHAHISIPQGAEEEGKQFYCGVLGLTQVQKPDTLKSRGGFWLKVGEDTLHVGTEDGVERLKTKAHIAYQVEDLSYWKGVLDMHNISVKKGIPIPGYERFEFRDPFGNRVELIQAL